MRPAAVPAVAFTLFAMAAPGAAPAAPAQESAPEQAPLLAPAEPLSALSRARMARWHAAWRDEAEGLLRATAALADLAGRPGRPDLRPPCLALGGALLELDRERLLPAPDAAVDLHLRRSLRALTRAAVTCLTERPYAARAAVAEGAGGLRQVRAVLARYSLRPEATPSP
ncbi:MAG TPA: hypothetical protein VLF66_08995 [Thermoanaerobaculia bacterium]|nr:hypothetical protein [Thermoanaerobaculia bacterium]